MPHPTYPYDGPSGKGTYTFPANFGQAEATSVATAILSEYGCSFEILWPSDVKERTAERLRELSALARDKVEDKAVEWIDLLRSGPNGAMLSDDVEWLLRQAFRAGWRAAPLGPRAVRP